MERPHIQSAGKPLGKSQFVEDLGDLGYGVESFSVQQGDFDR